VLIAIIEKQLGLEASLYTILQILSVSVFEKAPILQALQPDGVDRGPSDAENQLPLLTF